MNDPVMLAETKNETNGARLIFACPFCQLESTIHRHFGEAFILPAPAGILGSEDDLLFEQVRLLFGTEKITDVYFLSEISCDIVRNAFEPSPQKHYFENAVRSLFHESDDAFTIALKILRHQRETFVARAAGWQQLAGSEVRLHRIVAHKKEGRLLEVIE